MAQESSHPGDDRVRPDEREAVDFPSYEDTQDGLGPGGDTTAFAERTREGCEDICREEKPDAGTKAEIRRGLAKEFCRFVAYLEIERGVAASILDEIVDKIYAFTTYGANADPCGHPLRDVVSKIRLGSKKRRLTMYEGLLGPRSGILAWMPGTFSDNPNLYHKPISQHLKELLKIDKVAESVASRPRDSYTPWHESLDDVIFDVRSGERFKAIANHIGSEEVLCLRVFGDGFAMSRLGCHMVDKDAMYGIYFQLANLPGHVSRQPTSWTTVGLAEMTDVRDQKQVWSRAIYDIEQLQETGIWVPKLGKVVKVLLLSYAGDLKDQNLIANMSSAGSSTYPHTNTTVSLQDRRQCKTFDDINPLTKLRTRIEHQKHIEIYERTKCSKASFGVRGGSIMDPVCDFLHPGFFTPDISHTLHLGVLKADLSLILSTFCAIGDLSEESAAGMLTRFKDRLTGEEKSNFAVSVLGQNTPKAKVNLTGSISQLRVVGKYAPIIFIAQRERRSNNQALSDLAWSAMISLHRVFRYCESFALSREQIEDFQMELEKYVNLRIKLRDEYEELAGHRFDVLPKHVDLLFCAELFRMMGSMILTSTCVMESRHNIHKMAIEKGRNRVNKIKTLAEKTELLEKHLLGTLLQDSDVEGARWGVPNSEKKISRDQREQIGTMFGRHNVSLDVKVHGKTLKCGDYIDLYDDPSCETATTVKFLGGHWAVDESVRLLVEDVVAVYISDLDSFGVKEVKGNVRCVNIEALAGPLASVGIPCPWTSDRYVELFCKTMMIAKIRD